MTTIYIVSKSMILEGELSDTSSNHVEPARRTTSGPSPLEQTGTALGELARRARNRLPVAVIAAAAVATSLAFVSANEAPKPSSDPSIETTQGPTGEDD